MGASHSGTTVSSSAAFSAFYGGGSSYVVEKDEAKSKADVKNMKSTKATSKATLANKTEKGTKADNIKASHSPSFVRLYKMDECSICDDSMPDSDCLANLEQLYEHLSDKDKLSFLRFVYPDYDTTLTDKQCLATLETTFDSEDSDTEFELLAEGCVTYLEPSADAHSDDDMAPSTSLSAKFESEVSGLADRDTLMLAGGLSALAVVMAVVTVRRRRGYNAVTQGTQSQYRV